MIQIMIWQLIQQKERSVDGDFIGHLNPGRNFIMLDHK